MLDCFRRIDDQIFSPPHRFETILAYIVARLGLAFEQIESQPASAEASASGKPHEVRGHVHESYEADHDEDQQHFEQ